MYAQSHGVGLWFFVNEENSKFTNMAAYRRGVVVGRGLVTRLHLSDGVFAGQTRATATDTPNEPRREAVLSCRYEQDTLRIHTQAFDVLRK